MKAIVFEEYGSPDLVLQLKDVVKPVPQGNEVLVQINASSVNYADHAYVRGSPFMIRLTMGLFKPRDRIPGMDIAGVVEAVGGDVKRFKPGDMVFGDIGDCGLGAYAEYVSVPENALAHKPSNMTFDEAAAVAQAAVVALQGLRDKGQIQSGQNVLINGASGGVGTFAVQIAKSYGAVVTGVCSTGNREMVLSIGADHVIDYKHEDFTQMEERYDLILDIVANRRVSDYTRVLSPGGCYVSVAINWNSLLVGPLISATGGKKVVQLSHEPSVKDLVYMKGLIESGKVVSVIDRRFPLSETAEAVRYYGEGHPQGKIVITVKQDEGQGE